MRLLLELVGQEMELELDTQSLFIRLPLVGQLYKARGERAVWDSWKTVKEKGGR